MFIVESNADFSEQNETFFNATLHASLLSCFDRPYLLHRTYGGPGLVYARAFIDVVLLTSVVVVNTILIFAIRFYRHKNRGTTRVWNSGTSMKFVQLLAFSDVLVGLTVPLYLVPHYFCDVNDYVRSDALLCTAKFAATVFSALMSNVSLICIAVDRFIAIHYTIKYPIIMTHRRCHYMIGSTFIFSISTSSVLFVWNQWTPGSFCDMEDIMPVAYILTLGSFCHGVILVTVLGVHIQLHRKAAERAVSRPSIFSVSSVVMTDVGPLRRMSKDTSNSIKSAKVVVLVAGVYFLCWTPYSICLMVRVVQHGANPLTELIYQLLFPLSIVHSLANPFIYAWKNSEIQNAVVWSLRRASM